MTEKKTLKEKQLKSPSSTTRTSKTCGSTTRRCAEETREYTWCWKESLAKQRDLGDLLLPVPLPRATQQSPDKTQKVEARILAITSCNHVATKWSDQRFQTVNWQKRKNPIEPQDEELMKTPSKNPRRLHEQIHRSRKITIELGAKVPVPRLLQKSKKLANSWASHCPKLRPSQGASPGQENSLHRQDEMQRLWNQRVSMIPCSRTSERPKSSFTTIEPKKC